MARRRVKRLAWAVALVALAALVVLALAPAGGALPWTELVRTGSMEPTLSTGDLAVLRAIDGQEADVGDIVLFRDAGGARVLHRVVARSGEGFVTQGDANEAPDPGVVAPERVEARMVAHVPGVGLALAKLRGPLGVVLLVVLPSAFVLASEGRRILRREKGG